LYHVAPFTPATAIKLTALAIGTIYLVQIVLASLGVPLLVASVAGDVVVLAVMIGIARSRGLTARDFGVRMPPARFLVAAVLAGISMWYLTLSLVDLVQPPGDTKQLEGAVVQTALAPTLITLALFPALAEELVFRGILARGLARRFHPLAAVAISALVFGAYHVLPSQILSTAVLGLVLGFLTVRADSIVPAMIVHLLNNAIAIVLSRDEAPALSRWIVTHAPMTLVAALVCASLGVALAAVKGVA
jgi:sodium transport system permease protein